MTFCADLEPLDYFGPELAKVCVAVGWLDRQMPFRAGPTDAGVFHRLHELLQDPFEPFVAAGGHGCNICQFEPECSGGANLFVPAAGFLFVAPAMILHYVNAHRYRPPPSFSEAVMSCPDTRSMDYKRRFLENGGREIMRVAST
jgi:hypothetical protein